jgi:hypothetical protein
MPDLRCGMICHCILKYISGLKLCPATRLYIPYTENHSNRLFDRMSHSTNLQQISLSGAAMSKAEVIASTGQWTEGHAKKSLIADNRRLRNEIGAIKTELARTLNELRPTHTRVSSRAFTVDPNILITSRRRERLKAYSPHIPRSRQPPSSSPDGCPRSRSCMGKWQRTLRNNAFWLAKLLWKLRMSRAPKKSMIYARNTTTCNGPSWVITYKTGTFLPS